MKKSYTLILFLSITMLMIFSCRVSVTQLQWLDEVNETETETENENTDTDNKTDTNTDDATSDKENTDDTAGNKEEIQGDDKENTGNIEGDKTEDEENLKEDEKNPNPETPTDDDSKTDESVDNVDSNKEESSDKGDKDSGDKTTPDTPNPPTTTDDNEDNTSNSDKKDNDKEDATPQSPTTETDNTDNTEDDKTNTDTESNKEMEIRTLEIIEVQPYYTLDDRFITLYANCDINLQGFSLYSMKDKLSARENCVYDFESKEVKKGDAILIHTLTSLEPGNEYKTHEEVDNVINLWSNISLTQVSDIVMLEYKKDDKTKIIDVVPYCQNGKTPSATYMNELERISAIDTGDREKLWDKTDKEHLIHYDDAKTTKYLNAWFYKIRDYRATDEKFIKDGFAYYGASFKNYWKCAASNKNIAPGTTYTSWKK